MSDETTLLDEPVVSFTVREMLQQISSKLDTGFQSVSARLDHLESRTTALEASNRSKRESSSDRRATIAYLCSVVMTLTAVVSVWIALAAHH